MMREAGESSHCSINRAQLNSPAESMTAEMLVFRLSSEE
jgi:hypothetical protein